jgi:hypothetical protein
MTLTATSVHSDHGTVVLFDAEDDLGHQFVVAVDHRPAHDLADLLANGPVPIEAEPWQVRSAR